ncbi:uncharacterized protein [Procambarus clarkii]|uniref:uncharacterized protein n=1 Tax=Procambarus clarkii TaxID=6728 RepID=UPI003742F612
MPVLCPNSTMATIQCMRNHTADSRRRYYYDFTSLTKIAHMDQYQLPRMDQYKLPRMDQYQLPRMDQYQLPRMATMEGLVKELVNLVGALRTELDSLREEVRQLKQHQEETKEATSVKKTSSWQVVKDRGLKKTLAKPSPNSLRTSNAFDVLEDECCGEPMVQRGDKGRATRTLKHRSLKVP